MNHLDPLQSACLNVAGIKAADASGKLRSVQIANPHHFAGLEFAFAPRNPRWQKTLPIFAQSFSRAGVHKQCALGMVEERYPALTALEPAGLWHQQSTFFLAGKNRP